MESGQHLTEDPYIKDRGVPQGFPPSLVQAASPPVGKVVAPSSSSGRHSYNISQITLTCTWSTIITSLCMHTYAKTNEVV